MRTWILLGSLSASVAAAACGSTSAFTPDSHAMVTCDPGQQPVVTQQFVDGRTAALVQCVGVAPAASAPVVTVAPRAAYVPAVYTPAPSAPVEVPAPAPQVVTRPVVHERAPVVERSSDEDVAPKPERSWKKRAIVIGGSSGAGAGLGAIIGGKKGALIGAAIGAGGGTVYEMTRKD